MNVSATDKIQDNKTAPSAAGSRLLLPTENDQNAEVYGVKLTRVVVASLWRRTVPMMSLLSCND